MQRGFDEVGKKFGQFAPAGFESSRWATIFNIVARKMRCEARTGEPAKDVNWSKLFQLNWAAIKGVVVTVVGPNWIVDIVFVSWLILDGRDMGNIVDSVEQIATLVWQSFLSSSSNYILHMNDSPGGPVAKQLH